MSFSISFSMHNDPFFQQVFGCKIWFRYSIELVIHSCLHFNYNLNITCPVGNFPKKEIIEKIKSSKIKLFDDPILAVKNADVVVTDTWVSMGMKNSPERLKWSKFNMMVMM